MNSKWTIGGVIGLVAILVVLGVVKFDGGSGPVSVDSFFMVPAGQDVGLVASPDGMALVAKVNLNLDSIDLGSNDVDVASIPTNDVSVWIVYGADRVVSGELPVILPADKSTQTTL